jgi:hypothetical protein
MLFQEELSTLKKFREALMNSGRRDAVENIINVAYSEMGALSYSRILTALDGILLAGVVDNRKMILELTKHIQKLMNKLEELERRLLQSGDKLID